MAKKEKKDGDTTVSMFDWSNIDALVEAADV